MNDSKALTVSWPQSIDVMCVQLERWILLFALYGVVAADGVPYYAYDGHGNNLIHTNWGYSFRYRENDSEVRQVCG